MPIGYAGLMTDSRPDDRPDDQRVVHRAALLPEEQDAGSEDPRDQAAAILQESDERTAHPEETGARSSQTSTPADRPSDTREESTDG